MSLSGPESLRGDVGTWERQKPAICPPTTRGSQRVLDGRDRPDGAKLLAPYGRDEGQRSDHRSSGACVFLNRRQSRAKLSQSVRENSKSSILKTGRTQRETAVVSEGETDDEDRDAQCGYGMFCYPL